MSDRRPRLVAGFGGSLLFLVAGCGSLPASRAPAAGTTRPATPEACVASPRPQTLQGLPLVDARTQPIDPDMLGELMTWSSGGRTITAFIGINAIDVLEDLDFVPVQTSPGGVRQWTTAPYPTLFLAERSSGAAAPCDRVYVSTVNFPSSVAATIVAQLQVHRGPAEAVAPPGAAR